MKSHGHVPRSRYYVDLDLVHAHAYVDLVHVNHLTCRNSYRNVYVKSANFTAPGQTDGP